MTSTFIEMPGPHFVTIELFSPGPLSPIVPYDYSRAGNCSGPHAREYSAVGAIAEVAIPRPMSPAGPEAYERHGARKPEAHARKRNVRPCSEPGISIQTIAAADNKTHWSVNGGVPRSKREPRTCQGRASAMPPET